MTEKMEMSLEDIIKSSKSLKPYRGGSSSRGKPNRPNPSGGGGGGMQRNRRSDSPNKDRNRGGIQKSNQSRGNISGAWKHDKYDGPGPKRGGMGPISTVGGSAASSSKLLVSNLDYGVSESDINELFAEFGRLKSASMHYDRSGRSLGTADVIFERSSDAVKALKQYNGVPLDGRPMNIQLATSEVPSVGSRSRLGDGPVRPRPPVGGSFRRDDGPSGGGGPRRGAGPPRTGGGGRGGGGGRRNTPKAPTMTSEELDAELDAYVNKTK